jgi:hypothetical protein
MKIWAKSLGINKFLIVRHDGSVPAWPHFTLGARDKYSIDALLAYAKAVFDDPQGDHEYASSVMELANDFRRYRNEFGHGDPFAAPHRKEDPAVMRALRGGVSTIEVKPDKFP